MKGIFIFIFKFLIHLHLKNIKVGIFDEAHCGPQVNVTAFYDSISQSF